MGKKQGTDAPVGASSPGAWNGGVGEREGDLSGPRVWDNSLRMGFEMR